VILSALYSLVALAGLLVTYDVVSSMFNRQPQRVPSAITLAPVLAMIAYNEMQLSLIEYATRHRNPTTASTVWLIALPLGRTLRTAIMLVLMLPLVLVKLLTYFVYLMVIDPLSGIIRRLGGRKALRLGRGLLAASFILAVIGVIAATVFGIMVAQHPPPSLGPPMPVWLKPALWSALG